MTAERFFTGFVAALREAGVDFVDTRDDAHHKKFQAVVDRLRETRGAGQPGAARMPRTFMPTQVTGRYRELDDALLSLQRGVLSAPNPYYPGIDLKMSRDRAARRLSRFSDEERALFEELAETFKNA
jgi:hypothetical protein